MIIYTELIKRAQNRFGKHLRKLFINPKLRKTLNNKNFSILSSNCIGGVIYSDLHHPFLSPTINLYFEAKDFIIFLENLRTYLSLPLTFIDNKFGDYPLGRLSDITQLSQLEIA